MARNIFDPSLLQQDDGWQRILQRLPDDLDTSAFQGLALFRHRGFAKASLLLRLILAYACGLSMPMVTAWAAMQSLVTLSPEALHQRIKTAQYWMSALVLHRLAQQACAAIIAGLPLTLRLIDGTSTPRPGATGTDWRIHCSLNLRTQQLDEVEVTSDKTGESFKRFNPHPGDVFIGDRNFGTRRGIWHVIQHGADVLVRVILRNFPLQTVDGTAFEAWQVLVTLRPDSIGEWAVQTKPVQRIPAIPGRFIAYRLSQAAALKVREQHRKRRQRNGDGPPGAATLAGWEYVVLFTTLPVARFPPEVILALYRFRWQIELAIKRYKSLCGLAIMRTKLSTCCQTVLWAKLLLILLVEDLGARTEAFPPLPEDVAHSLSVWRMTHFLWITLVAWILPAITPTTLAHAPPGWELYFIDTLTTRPRQAAMAHLWLLEEEARYALC